MKPLLYFLLLLIPMYAYPQAFWSVVEDDIYYNKSHITDYASFQDTLIVVGGFVSDASCHYHNLRMLNFQGKQIWEIGGFCDLICTDSAFVYTAGFTGIDDVSGFEQVIISKYDRDGNEIYQIGFPDIPHDNWFYFTPVSINSYNNSLVIASSENIILKTDSSGSIESDKYLDLKEDIKNVLFLGQKEYMVITDHTLYTADSSFILSDSLYFTEQEIKTILFQDTIYRLSPGKLIRISTGLKIIDTLMTSSLYPLDDIASYNNNVWISEKRENNLELMLVQNSAVIDTLSFELLLRNQKFMVSENKFAFTGTSFSGQIAVFGCTPGEICQGAELPDIEMTGFSVDSIEFAYFPDYSGIKYPRGYYFNAEITIKNTGRVTINSFAVYAELEGGFNCVQNYFYRKFADIHLDPDSSATVLMRKIYQEGISFMENNNKLCFESLAPDSKIEKDITGNSLCIAFTINGIYDYGEMNSIKIYPNPAKDILNIETGDEGIQDIVITKLTGQIVYHKININNSFLNIVVSGLDPGMYLVRIGTLKQSICIKIVKN